MKKKLNKLLLVLAVVLCIVFVIETIQVLFLTYQALFYPMEVRMFDKLEELDVSEQYVVSEIEYNSETEPEQSRIIERRAYVMEYEGKAYEVYAYEMDSMESAKEYFSSFTDDSVDRDYDFHMNYAYRAPYVMYYEHRFLEIRYKTASFKELSSFANEINQHFAFDEDAMRND